MVLATLLADAAATAPRSPAIITASAEVTYGDLHRRARLLAEGLVAQGVGSFGASVTDVPAAVALLAAAAMVRIEACLYPADATVADVQALADDQGHTVLVTDRADLADGSAGPTRRVLRIPDLESARGFPTGRLDPDPAATPILILTTGTTGRPKGTHHSWERLLRGVHRRGSSPDDRWLLTYNLNQFAGIQVLLHVLATGGVLVVPPRNQPRVALALAAGAGVTHISATPTFWRYALGAPGATEHLDLRQITLGGEAVPGPLLEELRARFPHARVSQVYASTEVGSAVSVTDGRSGLPAQVLDRGDDADVQLRIVDGELQVRSRVGMLGYEGETSTSDGWRRTGDLVVLEGDRIRFVGRTHEVINVGGVKVHPLPIEEAALGVDAVVAARAHGRPNPVAGQVVQLDLVLRAGADPESVEDQVRAACGALAPAAQPRLITFVDDLPVHGQKVRRGG